MIADNFYVKLTVPALNCRSGASKTFAVKNILRDKEPHLVLKEVNGWGRLEDNTWIDLSFTERCERPKLKTASPSVFSDANE